MKIKDRTRENNFDQPPKALEKVADANTVIGESIITVSGAQVIPLSSVTVVNLSGGGEYGDIKTYKQADGFKIAGGNGSVVTVKPKGFLIDDENRCQLLRIEDGAIEALIEKTGDLVHSITDNA